MKLLLLCVVFAWVHVALLMAEEEHRASPTHLSLHQTDLSNPEKSEMFAQKGLAENQRPQAVKPRGNPALKAPRCSRLKQSCSPDLHLRCCDPCASCHCRLFNTICRCWRLSRSCQRKT